MSIKTPTPMQNPTRIHRQETKAGSLLGGRVPSAEPTACPVQVEFEALDWGR